jgi:uncharacterized protein YcfJ
MRTTQLITALGLGLVAATAAAGPLRPAPQAVQFTDTARVLSATPVYDEFNEPRRECWTERTGYTREYRDRSYGGALLGGIVGGVIGHQFGKGSGKDAATAAGAVIGAITGDNVDNSARPAYGRPIVEERCRTVDNWSRRVTGYDVVYRYQGNEYTTFLPYDPGPTLRLNVNVSVAERW